MIRLHCTETPKETITHRSHPVNQSNNATCAAKRGKIRLRQDAAGISFTPDWLKLKHTVLISSIANCENIAVLNKQLRRRQYKSNKLNIV